MSNSREQSQPSMEEILASIRKIIAEDDPQEDPRAAAPARSLGAERRGAPAEDDEVLNLTRVVEEDGRVVDLTDEPEVSRGAAEPERRGPARDLSESGAEAQSADPAWNADTVDTEEEDHSMTFSSPPQPAQASDAPEAPANRRGRTGGLMSEETSNVASAALSEIARTVRRNRAQEEEPMVSGDRSLEALVRDALGPHLKLWLDENLEPIVERVVREEVRRLARRVEDE